jgi:hypothetical protein
MHEAALAEQVDPCQISFLDSVRIIRDTVADMRNAPTTELPVLYRGMLKLIGQCRLPRPGRRAGPSRRTDWRAGEERDSSPSTRGRSRMR